MSKIVQAVNVMISNSSKISDVYRKENEFFFLYDGKYKWSIWQNPGEETYILTYYPSDLFDRPIGELVKMDANFWRMLDGSYVPYDTRELKTKEAVESFSELYLIVKEKQLGADKALQDIIDGDLEPF